MEPEPKQQGERGRLGREDLWGSCEMGPGKAAMVFCSRVGDETGR